MNKWRLLLFSILGLLQSATTERYFFDGVDRHRWSEARLSDLDPHHGYRLLSEQRQLNLPEDIRYAVRDVERTTLPAKRINYQETRLSLPTRNTNIFAKHRQNTDKFKESHESDYNRHSPRQINNSIRIALPSRGSYKENGVSMGKRLIREDDRNYECSLIQGEPHRLLHERKTLKRCIKPQHASRERHVDYANRNEINNQFGRGRHEIIYSASPRTSTNPTLTGREERNYSSRITRNFERTGAADKLDRTISDTRLNKRHNSYEDLNEMRDLNRRHVREHVDTRDRNERLLLEDRNTNIEENSLKKIVNKNGNARLKRNFNSLVSNKNTRYMLTLRKGTVYFTDERNSQRYNSRSYVLRDKRSSADANFQLASRTSNINKRYKERGVGNELFNSDLSGSKLKKNNYDVHNARERHDQENISSRRQAHQDKRLKINQNYMITTKDPMLRVTLRNIERDRSIHFLTERRESTISIQNIRNTVEEFRRRGTQERRISKARINPDKNARQYISRALSSRALHIAQNDRAMLTAARSDSLQQGQRHVLRSESSGLRSRRIDRQADSQTNSVSRGTEEKITDELQRIQNKNTKRIIRVGVQRRTLIRETFVKQELRGHSESVNPIDTPRNDIRQDARQNLEEKVADKLLDTKHNREKIFPTMRQLASLDKALRHSKTNMGRNFRSTYKIAKVPDRKLHTDIKLADNVQNIKTSREKTDHEMSLTRLSQEYDLRIRDRSFENKIKRSQSQRFLTKIDNRAASRSWTFYGKLESGQSIRVNREERRINRENMVSARRPSLTLSANRFLETDVIRQGKSRLPTSEAQISDKRGDRRSATTVMNTVERLPIKFVTSTENSGIIPKNIRRKLITREKLNSREERHEINSRPIRTFNLKQFKPRLYVRVRSTPTINNLHKENTFAWQWEYLFYLLQGIYICGLIFSKPNEELKMKRRVGDWFTSTKYLKLD